MKLSSVLFLLFNFCCACLAALPAPYVCTSTGDPHISPFTTSPFGLNLPGIQAPGYYLLASFGTTLVYQDQQLCGVVYPTAYCNFKVSVENSGVYVIVELDTVTVVNLFTFPFSPSIPVSTSITLPGVPISITHTAYRSYTIAVPEGYIEITPFSTAAQNIQITDNTVSPPFGGLCGTIIVGTNIDQFTQYWKVEYSDDPFGPESLADYNAANPSTWPIFVEPNPTGAILEQINLVCGVFENNPIVQAYAQFNDPQPYYGACYIDVAVTADVGWAALHVDAFLFKGKLTQPQIDVVLPTSPIRTTAVFQQNTIFIQARDAIGNPVQYQQPDQFEFAVGSGSAGQVQFSTPFDHGDGTYTVTFEAAPGNYDISISANNWDNQILGSPFLVTI